MTIFFRLLETDDKGTALHQAIQQLAQKQPNSNTFAVEPESFQQVPGAPFAYWVSNSVFRAFSELPNLRDVWGELVRGPEVYDLEESVRLWIEITPKEIGTNKKWCYYAKGGKFQRFACDIHLVVNFGNVRSGAKSFRRPGDENFYFNAGITYTQRTTSPFNARVLPGGCLTSPKGPAIVPYSDEECQQKTFVLLGLVNTKGFTRLVELRVGAASGAARSYDLGILRDIPTPTFEELKRTEIAILVKELISLNQRVSSFEETSIYFWLPVLFQYRANSLINSFNSWKCDYVESELKLAEYQNQIDNIILNVYRFNAQDLDAVELVASSTDEEQDSTLQNEDEEDSISLTNKITLIATVIDFLQYVLGSIFGRWNLCYVINQTSVPRFNNPFDPLPVCSPGMLVGENGLPPTAPDEVPNDYPIQIPFDGILVDDEGHPNDIIRYVRQVLNVIWGEKDSDIEQEACEILKVSSLRDYFRKPAAFFNDHLTRYSKSRRQAPIYLPLSTASGSYTLWLYYHRLTDQTLYTCINDYVEPKLNRVSETVKFLRGKTTRTRDEENDLEDLQTLEDELTKFRDELLRVAKLPWKPNLNDGVQITVAPLHSLFRLSKWQKKLKETWDKLEKGDYDWAHLAHSIWTARVREKCRTDKSLAIAHGLEDLYEPPPETPKRTKRKKKE